MQIAPATLESARRAVAAYDETFLATGGIDLSPLGRSLKATIWADDPKVGKVRHGFVSSPLNGAGGPDAWTFAGTLVPDGSFVEWLDDFDAFLVASPWLSSRRVHRGFLRFYNSLTVQPVSGAEQPIRDFIRANPMASEGAIFEGHSLGTATATFACLDASGAFLYLFAAPKPGDGGFRQAVFGSIEKVSGTIESYANPNDVVPRVPLTVDWPWKVEDFEHVVEPVELAANLASPGIPADWASSHHMPNYLRLLEAASTT